MAFKALVPRSLTDQFVQQVQNMILSGELKPGEKLPTERELAGMMSTSTSVINAGIKKLTAQGFLTVRPRKGVFIADYVREGNLSTLDALIDYGETHFEEQILSYLADFRLHYEVDFTRVGAKNRTQENLDYLKSYLDNMENTQNADEIAKNAYEFHHELAIASGNVMLAFVVATIRTAYISLYRSMLDSPERMELCRELFRNLYQAVMDQDADAAANVVTQSVLSWEKLYRKSFEK